jgi:prolyl-tRNA synthetase
MKDLYSFHADQEDLEHYYAVVQGAYDKIFARLGLSEQTYFTYASGGTFSKYSHEYQVLLPNGEDYIYISEEAEKKGLRIAVNKEIYEPGKTVCPVTGGTTFREEKASEAANIFQLGTKFSAPFGLSFADATGKKQEVIMGCYGIGISRLMGIIAEARSDDRGLIWPEAVAPADVYIVPVARSADDASFVAAMELKANLEKAGRRCIMDDRTDASVGFKLADADLIGVPVRVLISPKTIDAGTMEVTYRATGETVMIPAAEVVSKLS